MADPQIEDGWWLRLHKDIVEALMSSDLTGPEYAVVLAVIRMSYGFDGQKTTRSRFAFSVLEKSTRLSSSRLQRAVRGVIEKGIIREVRELKRGQREMELVKDYHQWKTIPVGWEPHFSGRESVDHTMRADAQSEEPATVRTAAQRSMRTDAHDWDDPDHAQPCAEIHAQPCAEIHAQPCAGRQDRSTRQIDKTEAPTHAREDSPEGPEPDPAPDDQPKPDPAPSLQATLPGLPAEPEANKPAKRTLRQQAEDLVTEWHTLSGRSLSRSKAIEDAHIDCAQVHLKRWGWDAMLTDLHALHRDDFWRGQSDRNDVDLFRKGPTCFWGKRKPETVAKRMQEYEEDASRSGHSPDETIEQMEARIAAENGMTVEEMRKAIEEDRERELAERCRQHEEEAPLRAERRRQYAANWQAKLKEQERIADIELKLKMEGGDGYDPLTDPRFDDYPGDPLEDARLAVIGK